MVYSLLYSLPCNIIYTVNNKPPKNISHNSYSNSNRMSIIYARPYYETRQTSLVFKWSEAVRLPNCQLFKWYLHSGLKKVCYSDDSSEKQTFCPLVEWSASHMTNHVTSTFWIMISQEFVIQMFPVFRGSLFKSPLLFNFDNI